MTEVVILNFLTAHMADWNSGDEVLK